MEKESTREGPTNRRRSRRHRRGSKPLPIIGLLAVCAWFGAGPALLAHPGGKNAQGCHTCRTNCAKWGLSNGQYHCHGGGTGAAPPRRPLVRKAPPRTPPARTVPERTAPAPRPLAQRAPATGQPPAEALLVVRVVDGDTFVARDGRDYRLVRLAGIDAPEPDQPFGDAARTWLRQQLEGRRVRVRPVAGEDCTARVEVLLQDGSSLAATQLRLGLAWASKGASEDRRELESRARHREVGLWGGNRPEPPWQFRQRTMGEPMLR